MFILAFQAADQAADQGANQPGGSFLATVYPLLCVLVVILTFLVVLHGLIRFIKRSWNHR
jgi:hypothetical protein